MLYQGLTGKTYDLSENYIGKGGEGIIYPVVGNDSLCAKIYRAHKRDASKEEKLKLMLKNHLTKEQLEEIIWPVDILYDNTGFAGCVMPRVKSITNLNLIYTDSFLKTDLKSRLVIAYNICAAVDTVHSIGRVCGDLNPNNISVNLDESDPSKLYKVTLLDIDSYHIVEGDKDYRCEVGLAGYVAPELQKRLMAGENLRDMPLPTYTKETDLFAVAVHIFSLLMNGSNPFACAKRTSNKTFSYNMDRQTTSKTASVAAPQPIDNIYEGFFPFHQFKSNVTYPLYAPSFNSLPEVFRELFIKTFEGGYYDPKVRATTVEWMNAIRLVAKDYPFPKCVNMHFYFPHNSQCPYCQIIERWNVLNPPVHEPKPVNKPTPELTPENQSTSTSYNDVSGSGGVGAGENSKQTKTILALFSIVVILAIIIFAIIWSEYNEGKNNSKTQQSGYVQEDQYDYDLEGKKEYMESVFSALYSEDYDIAISEIKDSESNEYVSGMRKLFMQYNSIVSNIDSGSGRMIDFDNDYAYEGMFEDGVPNGQGIEYGIDKEHGNSYYYVIGEFENGYPHGECSLWYPEWVGTDNNFYSICFYGNYYFGLENGLIYYYKYPLYDYDNYLETVEYHSEMGSREEDPENNIHGTPRYRM